MNAPTKLVVQSIAERAVELRKAAVRCDSAYQTDSPLGQAASHLADAYRAAARLLEERSMQWLQDQGPAIRARYGIKSADARVMVAVDPIRIGQVEMPWHPDRAGNPTWIPVLDGRKLLTKLFVQLIFGAAETWGMP